MYWPGPEAPIHALWDAISMCGARPTRTRGAATLRSGTASAACLNGSAT